MVRRTRRLGDKGVVRGGEDDGVPIIRDGRKGVADVVRVDVRKLDLSQLCFSLNFYFLMSSCNFLLCLLY